MNRDFRDLLAEFNVQGVEYLVVGAHALAAHGHVRATKDLDVWVRPDTENATRTQNSLCLGRIAAQNLGRSKALQSPRLVLFNRNLNTALRDLEFCNFGIREEVEMIACVL